MNGAAHSEHGVVSAAPLPGVSLAAVRDLLRRAVLTLGAVPDPDLRYRLGAKGAWPPFVQETRDAYGSAPPKVRMFHPTRRDLTVFLDVLGMLSWYRRERSEATVRLFVGWVNGAAMWELQERCSTNRRRPASPNTVHNRLNGMVLAIVEEFPETIFRYMLDELHKMTQKTVPDGEGGEISSTDANLLPKSPVKWSAPAEAKLTPKQEERAHRLLTEKLERNKSRALDRKQKRARKATSA